MAPHPDAAQIAFDQGDSRTSHGNVGADVHPHPDLRPCNCRSVVDPIACRRHTLRLKVFHDGGFLIEEHLGLDLIDAKLFRNSCILRPFRLAALVVMNDQQAMNTRLGGSISRL
jgi:hypothetical protein